MKHLVTLLAFYAFESRRSFEKQTLYIYLQLNRHVIMWWAGGSVRGWKWQKIHSLARELWLPSFFAPLRVGRGLVDFMQIVSLLTVSL